MKTVSQNFNHFGLSSAEFQVELPNEARSNSTVKVDGRFVEVGQFAYDALQVMPSTQTSMQIILIDILPRSWMIFAALSMGSSSTFSPREHCLVRLSWN